MLTQTLRSIVGALAAALFAGCQGDPNAGRYATTRPTSAEITGVWNLDFKKSDWQPAVNAGVSHTLELKADGSVIASNIPDVWNFDDRQVKGGYDSGVGTWHIKEDQGKWVLELNFSELNGVKPGPRKLLHLVGKSSDYQILGIIGDPDDGKSLVFLKEPSKQ